MVSIPRDSAGKITDAALEATLSAMDAARLTLAANVQATLDEIAAAATASGVIRGPLAVDLPSLVMPDAAQAVQVAGFADHGVGAAMFKRSASLVSGGFTTANGVHLEPEGILPIEAFGGGRGVLAEDTAAFRKCINLGRPIRLAAKAYKVDCQALGAISGKVAIIGASREHSIIEWHNPASAKSLFAFDPATLNEATIERVTFDCRCSATGDPGGYFAAVDFCGLPGSSVLVDGAIFRDGHIVDIRVRGTTGAAAPIRATITRNLFDNGLVGSASRAAIAVQIQDNVDVVYCGNHAWLDDEPASYGRASCIVQRAIAGVESQASVIAIGNISRNMGRKTADFLDGGIGVYSGGRGCIIANNVAHNAQGRAFTAKGDQRSIVISGNVVAGVKGGTSTCALGVMQNLYVPTENRDFSILNNMVSECDGDGVFVDGLDSAGAAYNLYSVVVRGNQIRGWGNRGIYVRNLRLAACVESNLITGGSGIQPAIGAVSVAGSLLVTGNTVDTCPMHAVDIAPSADLKLVAKGNHLRNIGSGNASARGLSLGAIKSYVIDGNTFDGCAIAVATSGSSEQSVIDNNVMNGVTSPWSRSGVDAAVWWGDGNIGPDLSFSARSVTVAAGAINAFAGWHWVVGEGGVADDVTTISGVPQGKMLTLRAASNTVDITLKDGGSLALAGDMVLDNGQDSITLLNSGAAYVEVARSNNAT